MLTDVNASVGRRWRRANAGRCERAQRATEATLQQAEATGAGRCERRQGTTWATCAGVDEGMRVLGRERAVTWPCAQGAH